MQALFVAGHAAVADLQHVGIVKGARLDVRSNVDLGDAVGDDLAESGAIQGLP